MYLLRLLPIMTWRGPISSSSEKRGICGICSAGCWVVAQYDSEGRIERLRPDEGTPMGILCRLGQHARDIIYSKDRLLHPMRRKGPKGGFEFERIGWDEAYCIIAERLKDIKQKHGPEAAAIYTGVGTFEQSLCDVFQPKGVAVSSASSLLFPYGSPNTMGVGALCYVAYGVMAPHLCTGKMLIDMHNETENSEAIFVWGTNPATDQPPVEMRRILNAHQRGARIIVIDPRRTPAARLQGAQWVPIRPGTDGALALGMCNVLIEEELFDEDFVRDWTHGFNEFSQYVQHFRPEVVESITSVPKDTVVSLARLLASARGASQLMYTGLEYSGSGVQSIRASLALWALAGQLDVPGGRCFNMPGESFGINTSGHIANPGSGPGIDAAPRLGAERFPLYIKYRDEAHAISLPESVLEGRPYKVRMLLIQGGSIITSWPEPQIWEDTLSGLDFLVTIDRQLTADAAYADIVLPASTYFETTSYMKYGPVFRIRERLMEPLGESRPDYRIMRELAGKLGYAHLYPEEGEPLIRHALSGSGFSYEDVLEAGGTVTMKTGIKEYRKWEKGLLRPDGRPGFDTPTGKFEIHSTVLEEYGYPPLPEYTEPAESPRTRPDLLARYPLVLTSGSRSASSFHTQHVGNTALGRQRPEPGVLMNTHDAHERDIIDGERVRISTRRGSVVMRAQVSDNIMRGAIDANHGGGGPLGNKHWQQANVNTLTGLDLHDPISGFPAYRSLLCDVAPEGDGSAPLKLSEEKASVKMPGKNGKRPLREVYLDNNATTPLAPEATELMRDAAGVFGNASSIYARGRQARRLIDEARQKLAGALGTTARRIVFTGGGSEANNLAIKGALFARGLKGAHAITSSIEHPSVLNVFEWLERMGVRVTYLPVDSMGIVDMAEFKDALTSDTALVSIMYANNETGAVQPVAEMAALAREAGALMHTDAVQCMGRLRVDLKELGVDLLSVSAHKLHGPKGVGALYTGRGVRLESLVHGGGQEHGMRSGTENVNAIAGFGRAIDNLPSGIKASPGVASLCMMLRDGIARLIPGARVNGPGTGGAGLPNTLNLTLPGIRGESMVLALDRYGVCVSSGSACKSGSASPSHVLMAMGLTQEEAHCSLRLSLSHETSREDIEYTLYAMGEVVTGAASEINFVPCR